jgi:hypothetical protein
MKVFVWQDLSCMSRAFHKAGGIIVIADSLDRAREILKEDNHWNMEEGSSMSTALNTDPAIIIDSIAAPEEEKIFYFPNAGCC